VGNRIALSPPLIISEAEIEEMFDKIEATIMAIHKAM
jgi:adenosylmethionine-8-amino-7-oxononanoate aminotransferase